ncbi:hypothetical protein ACFL2A_04580 [Thermodesulfobacteriota bacterium]
MISDQDLIDNIINAAKDDDSAPAGDEKDPQSSPERLTPNKIIDRLDDVTIKSEEEATKIVESIDEIVTLLGGIDKFTKEIKGLLDGDKLGKEEIGMLVDKINSTNNDAQDKLFNAMNLLQYQDVLRQKIEKIAASLSVFYEYLGEFLGRGTKTIDQRATGKHVEDSTLNRDQKLDEIDDIIRNVNKD